MRHIAVATGMVAALGLSIALTAMLVPTRARGQTPAEGPSRYTLEVDAADVAAIGQAINELPKRVADPLIAKLQAQIQAQAMNHRDAAAKAQQDKQPRPEEPKKAK